jgi:hypothetical protein
MSAMLRICTWAAIPDGRCVHGTDIFQRFSTINVTIENNIYI